MSALSIIISLIIFILFVGLVIFLLWWFLWRNNPQGICHGAMKDDNLCCDSIFKKSDYDAIKNQCNDISDLPDDVSTVANKNSVLKFLLGVYQKHLSFEKINNLGAEYTYNDIGITKARMFVYTPPDRANEPDVLVIFAPTLDYNYMKSQGLTNPIVTFPTDLKSFDYLQKQYTKINNVFNPKYPTNVKNLYILCADDSASLGIQFRIDHTSTNSIQFNIGEVATFSTDVPNDSKMYNLTYVADPYITVLSSTLKSTSNIVVNPSDPNYMCLMDYHKTPYFNSFNITA